MSQRTVHNSQFDQRIFVNPSCISSPFLINQIFFSEFLPSDVFIIQQTLIMTSCGPHIVLDTGATAVMWMSWWSWHSKDMGKCLFFSSFASRWALWGHIDPFHEYLEFVQPSSACGHWTHLGPQLSSFHPSFHYFLPYSLRNVPSITIFSSRCILKESKASKNINVYFLHPSWLSSG